MNNRIAYEQLTNVVYVYLDGRRIGTIRKGSDGYRYFPKGDTVGGDSYCTIGEVKKSLEED